jgi:hypothetical protein
MRGAPFFHVLCGRVGGEALNAYTHDAENRLISMNSGSYTASFDALGNRVEQTSAGVTNDYIFGLNGKVLHYNASTANGLGQDIYAGDEHVGLYASGTTYMVHHDQLGSTRKWTVYSGINRGQTGRSPIF